MSDREGEARAPATRAPPAPEPATREPPAQEPARGVVIAHGELANGLVSAVRQIAGVTPEALVGVPNLGLGREELCARTVEALSGPRNLIFTDLPGGSCHLAAMIVTRRLPEVPVVTGVNLPMLLDFVFNRGLEFEELVPRLTEKGRAAIGGNRPRPC